eukprot:scaffold1525_cov142-Cylindrotheca_fusiformis.AAC.175
MVFQRNPITALCIALAALSGVSAFAPAHRVRKSTTSINMAPKFDPTSQKWIPQNDDEATPAYGPVGSLIRAGPLPFIQRLINGEEYEQGVLKMMATDGYDRKSKSKNPTAFDTIDAYTFGFDPTRMRI